MKGWDSLLEEAIRNKLAIPDHDGSHQSALAAEQVLKVIEQSESECKKNDRSREMTIHTGCSNQTNQILIDVRKVLLNTTDRNIHAVNQLIPYLRALKYPHLSAVKKPLRAFIAAIAKNPKTDPSETNEIFLLQSTIREKLHQNKKDPLALAAKDVLTELLRSDKSVMELSTIACRVRNVLCFPTHGHLYRLKKILPHLVSDGSVYAPVVHLMRLIAMGFIIIGSALMLLAGAILTAGLLGLLLVGIGFVGMALTWTIERMGKKLLQQSANRFFKKASHVPALAKSYPSDDQALILWSPH